MNTVLYSQACPLIGHSQSFDFSISKDDWLIIESLIDSRRAIGQQKWPTLQSHLSASFSCRQPWFTGTRLSPSSSPLSKGGL